MANCKSCISLLLQCFALGLNFFSSSCDELLSPEKFCNKNVGKRSTDFAETYPEFFSEISSIRAYPGHWPVSYCKITNVYLKSADKAFFVGLENLTSIDACYGTRNLWNFKLKDTYSTPVSPNQNDRRAFTNFHCDQVFQTGYVLTIYYYHGSNYFHIHYDAALPLYYALHNDKFSKVRTSKNIIVMPSVEIERGKGTDWNTNAFMNESTYWNSLMQLLSEPYMLLPLDKKLVGMEKTFCFKEIFFGTPKADLTNANIIQGYVEFMKSRLHILPLKKPINKRKNIGLIHRAERRKILNEELLINSIKKLAEIELVDFVGLPFSKQVEIVQKFDILIGMNGAGLMNALYLPNNSVAIQLIPYDAQVNYLEYRELLKARGPYLDWHNKHSNLSRAVPEDKYNNNIDTCVNLDEFVALVRKALQLLT